MIAESGLLPVVTLESIHEVEKQKLQLPAGAERVYVHDTYNMMSKGNPYLESRLPRTIIDVSSKYQAPYDIIELNALDLYSWLHKELELEQPWRLRDGSRPALPEVSPGVLEGVVLSHDENPNFLIEAIGQMHNDGNTFLGTVLGSYVTWADATETSEGRACAAISTIVYRALHNQAEINMLDRQLNQA